MAAGNLVLDTTTINNKHLDGAIADELLEAAPLFSRLVMKQSTQGHVHQHLRYNNPPAVGFRTQNNGRDETHSEDANVTLNLAILDASFSIDAASVKGTIGGIESLIDREGRRHLRSAFYKAGRQVVYGTTTLGDTGGFTGFINNTNLDALADPMVFDGGGSSADVQTSVYLIRTGFDDVAVVSSDGGNITMEETTKQRIIGANSKPYTGWYTPMYSWYGLQQGGLYSISRIANIEASLTDDMIAEALSAHPTDRMPNLIAMSRKAARLLRESRTATNPSGQPAPFPESVFGIEIVITDEIVNTEPVET